jgi:hypothetical protein
VKRTRTQTRCDVQQKVRVVKRRSECWEMVAIWHTSNFQHLGFGATVHMVSSKEITLRTAAKSQSPLLWSILHLLGTLRHDLLSGFGRLPLGWGLNIECIMQGFPKQIGQYEVAITVIWQIVISESMSKSKSHGNFPGGRSSITDSNPQNQDLLRLPQEQRSSLLVPSSSAPPKMK